MWRKAKDFCASWQGKVVIGGLVLTGIAGWVLLRRKTGKPPLTKLERDPKYVQIDVLSKELLLKFFTMLREKYSKEYLAMRNESRIKRRLLEPNSQEYRDTVLFLTEKSKDILEAKTMEVLGLLNVTEETIDHSLFYYVKDADIEEAKKVVNEPINDVRLPESVTVEKTRDILAYFQEHLVAQDEDSLDEYLVATAQVEDEVFKEFGVESEVVEKAYEKYGEQLQEIADSLKYQTRFVLQQTSEDSFESETSP